MKVTKLEYIVQWAEEKRHKSGFSRRTGSFQAVCGLGPFRVGDQAASHTDQVGVSDPQKDRESGADLPADVEDLVFLKGPGDLLRNLSPWAS